LAFGSILFGDRGTPADIDTREAPECFTDLNLDQIVAAVTAGRGEYKLEPFFYAPLADPGQVNDRHGVLRDLEDRALFDKIGAFAAAMRGMRAYRTQSDRLTYKYQKQRLLLDAMATYCQAIARLLDDLNGAQLDSRWLRAFREYLAEYVRSDPFVSLTRATQQLTDDLSAVRYSLHIHGGRIHAARYASEPDYSADVRETFDKFKQGTATKYRFEFHSSLEMNHIEAAILDLVARLYPEIFSALEEYCARHAGDPEPRIAGFDREIQFYIAWMEYQAQFERAGLPFCYPAVSAESKEVQASGAYDLALAARLIVERTPVVTNGFRLSGPERILVVSGPNQGGKTTFSRAFGQIHYLASIGCTVPASEARVLLFDRLFTHFEREEDIRNLTSKMEDELLRIRRILDCATPSSILIMNESFLSTTLDDALLLSRHVMERISALDLLCVSVTFLDELASMSDKTVSMMGTVDPDDPARRTFRIVRRPADGLAYAAAIAEKHGVTYDRIKERIAERGPR
jgi:DNA mismatch repair protein MutS